MMNFYRFVLETDDIKSRGINEFRLCRTFAAVAGSIPDSTKVMRDQNPLNSKFALLLGVDLSDEDEAWNARFDQEDMSGEERVTTLGKISAHFKHTIFEEMGRQTRVEDEGELVTTVSFVPKI
jgi:hypothetical protein